MNVRTEAPERRARPAANDTDITVVGGAGHVGIPLVLAFAETGARVNVNDLNFEAITTLQSGRLPFIEHGAEDLRVAHFVGLHAFQALPLLALLLPAGWTDGRRARVVCVGAVSYAGLFGILLWQALGGESVAVPAPATLAALSLWAAASVSAAWLAATSRRAAPRWDRRAARAAPGRALRASR
jgi:hypothetical protein